MARISGLFFACHPAPTAAVTSIMTILAWRSGWSGGKLIEFFVAVVAGQLSVGWSNDAHDAGTDLAGDRSSKPTVAKLVGVQTLWAAALLALAVSIGVSLAAAGFLGGAFHVCAVLVAWVYNLGISRTIWSWLPYAISFGCIPPFITYGLNPPMAPAWWSVVVFAGMGVAAHLANALPDLAADAQAGVGGLASRLGAERTRGLALVLLVATSILLLVVLQNQSPIPALLGAALVALCAGSVMRSGAPRVFLIIMLLAGLEVVLIVTTGVSIASN